MARHHTELVMEGGGAGGHTNHGCTAGAGPRDPGSGQQQHQTPASTGSCFYTVLIATKVNVEINSFSNNLV